MERRDLFDVVVVGARCCGAPLATLLARRGMTVCLVDRARFPSNTPSTHGIQPAGVELLKRLGVLPDLLRVAAVIEHAVVRFDDARFVQTHFSRHLGGPMLNIRRGPLDTTLLQAALRAGAVDRTDTVVTGLIHEDGRVVGVRSRHGSLRARLVIGADGARSTVARLVGAKEYAATPAGRAFIWGYFEGARVPADRVWIGRVADHGFLGSHTDAGLFMAAVAPPLQHWRSQRTDRHAAFASGLGFWDEFGACLDGATLAGPIHAMAGQRGFFRQAAGPGWALAGDAGHSKDPSAGQGISDALRQAFALAPAIETGLSGGPDAMKRALADWWRWRDKDTWQMYWFAHDVGAPGPHPVLVREIQRRVAHDPGLALGLLRVLNHDIAPSGVFTPALGLKTVARMLRHGSEPRRKILGEARQLGSRELRRHRQRPRGKAWPGA
jgi:2-polyprenyl-6-methoxyphenol hydroxylase-like FAD-dependent oxidoreductase